MWNHEVSVDAPVSPSAVWQRYVDLDSWPIWSPGTEKVSLDGEFTAGSEGVITNAAYGSTPFRLTSVTDGETFAMESPVSEDVTLRTVCRVVALAEGGSRVTHQVELDGPGSEQLGAEIGEGLSNNLSEGLRSLVESVG
ncbi:SRPBCC family protein [Streptomyces cinerochromogenes]|uniref:SRPBCC family protein n=1 Tax=Streptomyces cinerochromogenes TaxID=66422 RepID=UPI0033B6FB00